MHRSFQKSKTLPINNFSKQVQSEQTFKKRDSSQNINPKDKSKSRKSFFFKKSKSKSYVDDLPDEECSFLIMSSDGNPEKQFQVARYYIEGTNNFLKYMENGINFLKKAIKSDCIEAIIYCSNMFIKGDIIPRDLTKAKKILKKHRKKENASALYLYRKIKKKEKNFNSAAQYFAKASKNGNAAAMYNYVKLLFQGLGCIKNDITAKYYFDMAKKNGIDKYDLFLSKQNGNSLYHYGMKLYSSREFEENKEEAANYFQLAINKDNILSMVQYALMLLKGDGVEVDKQKAFSYFKTAAEKGNTNGMYYAGDMLYRGDGIPIDKNEAQKYLKNAIIKGNSLAKRDYSKILEKNDINQKDRAQKVKANKDAADKGNINQSYTLGMKLLKGIDCQANPKEGIRYIKEAAEKYHVDAMYEYAKILEKGYGIPQNIDSALHYYNLAAEKGHIDAKKCYANILERQKCHDKSRYKHINIKIFNSFPLKVKHSIISEIAFNNQNDYLSGKLHNFSTFIMQFNELKEKKCFEFIFNDNTKLLSFLNSDKQIKIQIPWMTSEVLLYYSVTYDALNEFLNTIQIISRIISIYFWYGIQC